MKLADGRLGSISPGNSHFEKSSPLLLRIRKSKECIIPGTAPFSQKKKYLPINFKHESDKPAHYIPKLPLDNE